MGTGSGSGSFLFVTWPGGGNIHPLVALGTRLVAAGHKVRVLGAESLARRFESEGIGFRPHRATRELRGLVDDVIEESKREPTDVVVIDYMQPHALCGGELLDQPVVAFVHTLYQRVALGAMSPMHMSANVDVINELRAELGLAPVESLPALLDLCARVLVVTARELDRPEEPVAANVRYVGPLVENAGAHAGWTPPWPSDDLPLVHVSMGTVPDDALAMPVVQIALDALGPLPVHVLATLPAKADRPWSNPSEAALDDLRLSENAAVSRYIRHAAVLPHTQLFITHAGLGSVGAALTFGVPMVCLPIFHEQPDNAAHVEALGAGRRLPMDTDAETLRDVVSDVLSDESYRTMAQRIATSLQAHGNGRSAVSELELLHT